MEKEHPTFGSPTDRLRAINRTVDEHSAHNDVDIRSIVESAMDAYSAQRIEEAGLQDEVERTTIVLARRVAEGVFNPITEMASDFLAVAVPAIAYLPLVYLIVAQVGEWNTPVPQRIIFLAVAIPTGLGIALVIVSVPKREYRAFPLGVFKDTIGRFTTRLPIGAAVSGLLLTGVSTLAVLHNVNAQRENRALSFSSAKTILVDKSLSRMKELQISSTSQVSWTNQTEIPLSPNNTISIRTQNSPQAKRVTYVIDDKGAFPGQLEADVGSGSGTVSWTEDGKAEVQTRLYVCKVVQEASQGTIVVKAISDEGSVSQTSSTNASKQESGTASIHLIVNGVTIELTFNSDLININDLAKDQRLVLAYDPRTHVASRVDAIVSLPPNGNSSEGTKSGER
jgi:hypothetical protein